MDKEKHRPVSEFGDEYILLTDGQDIRHKLSRIAYSGDKDDYGCLFVKRGEVWGIESNVPWLDSIADRLY